jgi:tetratricopeptide (TPR) repeat protein
MQLGMGMNEKGRHIVLQDLMGFRRGQMIKKRIPRTIFGLLMASLWLCFFASGCGPGPRPLERILDTPEHHTFNGFKLLKKERLDDAQREFEIALRLKPDYSPAHRGMGLVHGMKGEFGPAFVSMGLAREYARDKKEEGLSYVGLMRLHTMRREEGWLEEVERNFRLATTVTRGLPAAYYYMGLAYKYGYRFADSGKSFKKVLELQGDLAPEADEQMEIIRKIEEANPRSDLGKELAIRDRMTRADVAGLLVRELRLDEIHEKRPWREEGTSLRSSSIPPDVEGHRLKSEIEKIVKLNIRGLGLLSDGTFGPDELVTRANYAIVIADIIAKVEGDSSLNHRYIGRKSPFKDVGKEVPYFNALMVCTTRGGIMEAKEGVFDPMEDISGADALLSIQRLRKELGTL